MPTFEQSLNRMKELITYGKNVNESKKINAHSLEYSAIAADGKSYGIVRENSKYYVKCAPASKANIAEAYDYIGGINNKKNHEYQSFSNAQRHLEMKLSSLNEAHKKNIKVETLDPFKKAIIIAEATDKMKDEIARCRQIMYNSAVMVNEASEIGASNVGGVKKFNGKNPEAKTGEKGFEEICDTTATAKPDYKGSKVERQKSVSPFTTTVKEGCECGGACDCEKDWASKGLPSKPGTGVANSAHNNGIFSKSVNEEEDIEDMEDVEDIEEVPMDDEFDEDFEDVEGDEFDDEEELDLDDEDEDFDEDIDSDDDLDFDLDDEEELDIDDEDEDFDEDSELDVEIGDDEEDEDDGFDSEGDDLEADDEAILESFIRKITKECLHETKLNAFGKHPGYRKKPMELPSTGVDRTASARDWNDDSVYSELPFGERIGSSFPYEDLVERATDVVMQSLSGSAFKKKVK